MKIIDKIVLNRLISTITNFILGILKIFAPQSIDQIDVPKPKRRILPWRKKDE